jgi:Skp family chaperone for outer membrane proteins
MTTRSFLIAALLFAGCGTRIGYVDPERSVQQTDEWRAVQADVKAYAESRQPELDALKDALVKARTAKASAEEIVAKETKYGEMYSQVQAEAKRRADAGAAKISAAEARMAEALALAEGFDVVAFSGGAAYINPKVDLTAKMAKRYDEQAGAASVAQVAELRAQVADMKTKEAALEAKQGSPALAKK